MASKGRETGKRRVGMLERPICRKSKVEGRGAGTGWQVGTLARARAGGCRGLCLPPGPSPDLYFNLERGEWRWWEQTAWIWHPFVSCSSRLDSTPEAGLSLRHAVGCWRRPARAGTARRSLPRMGTKEIRSVLRLTVPEGNYRTIVLVVKREEARVLCEKVHLWACKSRLRTS